MKAIFNKEFKRYFASPIGYIFTAVFMILAAMFFLNGCIMYQVADISAIFSNINVVYLFLVSILTMRSFSEERNKKTDQLLLTAPCSVGEIVLGKYLAAMAVLGITVLISLIFPVVLCMFGNPPVSEIIGSYIGFVLLWGAFIAVGIFISSLTESQMIAAVFTFGVLLLIYFLDGIISGISNRYIATVLSWFSLMRRYSEFQRGILNIVNVVYYLSFIFAFLFLTGQGIERRRFS